MTVTIIGGGPSGLFAAYQLSRFVKKAKIAVIEKGSYLGAISNQSSVPASPVNPIGYGGAGIFADKLYFDVAGGWLEDEGKIDAKIYMSLVSEVVEKFSNKAITRSNVPKRVPEVDGLVYKPYRNTVAMNSNEYSLMIRSLLRALRLAGVQAVACTEVTEISRRKDEQFRLRLSHGESILSDVVVVATGRGGSTWLESQSPGLGLQFEGASPLLGVRIETISRRVKELKSLGLDPKFKANYEEDHSTKTHCVCYDGNVISCRCEDLILVDGTRCQQPSRNTSFNILTGHAPGLTRISGRRVVREILARNHGFPIVQLMDDFRLGTATTRSSLASNRVRPTLTRAKPGNIAQFYPPIILERIYRFLDLLTGFAPHVLDSENLVYAPVFEWFYPRVKHDERTRTTTKGLFVAGDVAGLSQGVVMACASGLQTAVAVDEYIESEF